jgi:hypothetical protein
MERLQEEFNLIRTAGELLTEIDDGSPAHPERLWALIDARKIPNPDQVFDIASQLEVALLSMDENETQH